MNALIKTIQVIICGSSREVGLQLPDHVPSHQHTIGSPTYCFRLTTMVMLSSTMGDKTWFSLSQKSSSHLRVNLPIWAIVSNNADNLESNKHYDVT